MGVGCVRLSGGGCVCEGVGVACEAVRGWCACVKWGGYVYVGLRL